ncbi:hypothetical protein ACSBR2_022723 [Camellia fascicularis]
MMLLSLNEKNPCQIFEGEALLWRMNKYGLLDVSQNKLDYVLALTVESFLERCLHTVVFKTGMAKLIHIPMCSLGRGISGLGGKWLIYPPSW